MGPLFCSEFEPALTDDAFSGGNVDDVFEACHHELQLAHRYGLHVDPGKLGTSLGGIFHDWASKLSLEGMS